MKIWSTITASEVNWFGRRKKSGEAKQCLLSGACTKMKNSFKKFFAHAAVPSDSVLVAQPGSTLLDKTCAGDNVSLSTTFPIYS